MHYAATPAAAAAGVAAGLTNRGTGWDQPVPVAAVPVTATYRPVRTCYTLEAQTPDLRPRSFVSEQALTPYEIYQQLGLPEVLGRAWDSQGSVYLHVPYHGRGL